MNSSRPTFSVCIPAYNRVRYLPALLDSVFSQSYTDFDVVICEDNSPERAEISRIVASYAERSPGRLRYYENSDNLGYDGNIRNLVEKAAGEFCFFMGNDDLMNPGALATVADIVRRHDNIGIVVKSYTCFDDTTGLVTQEIRYFAHERVIAPGSEGIAACFRRSGVISGYVVHRDSARTAATARFDGTLYYQLHLTARVLCRRAAVFTPEILVSCRGGVPPDFGNSASEAGAYIPGRYTPAARLNMVRGALSIAEHLETSTGVNVVKTVKRDYANHFYVYIQDQLHLPVRQFAALYWQFAKMGLYKHPLFTANCVIAYLLGARRTDQMINTVRRFLGRTR